MPCQNFTKNFITQSFCFVRVTKKTDYRKSVLKIRNMKNYFTKLQSSKVNNLVN